VDLRVTVENPKKDLTMGFRAIGMPRYKLKYKINLKKIEDEMIRIRSRS